MKKIAPSIDENALWNTCFPHLYRRSLREGVYVVVDGEQALRNVIIDEGVEGDLARCELRVDMAISFLWPYVSHLFLVDFFPHRLAAATDLLRAAEFGEGQQAPIDNLARELADALNALEAAVAKVSLHLVDAAQDDEDK